MQAYFPYIAGAFVACFNTIQHDVDNALIGGAVVIWNEVIVEQIIDRLRSVRVNVDTGSVFESSDFAFEMNTRDKAPQLLLQLVVIEVGRPPAMTRIDGYAMVPRVMQGNSILFQRGYNRNVLPCQSLRKAVFLQNRVITPAFWAIKFSDDGCIVLDTNLVYAVLIAVQGQKSSIAPEAQFA